MHPAAADPGAEPPGITELVVAPLFSTIAVVLLFAVPLLAMRLIAEGRRNQTMVLVSALLSMTEIASANLSASSRSLLDRRHHHFDAARAAARRAP
jgi:hypothetical protein